MTEMGAGAGRPNPEGKSALRHLIPEFDDAALREEILRRALADDDVRAFLADTKAVDADGHPSLCWRGEHGLSGEPHSTKLAALSFGDVATANLYALSPNDRDMPAEAPRVAPWLLRIERPLMNCVSDPFLDLSILASAIGREETVAIALRMSSSITDTNHWDENHDAEWGSDVEGLLRFRPDALDELYLPAFNVLDDHAAVALIRQAGHDGAICCGWGENGTMPEWRLFDASDALPAYCPSLHLPQRKRLAA
jgi:hypothetical protein